MADLRSVNGRYGSWAVLSSTLQGTKKHPKVLCQCVCGRQRLVHLNLMRQGTSTQCSSCASTRHGQGHNGLQKASPTYVSWQCMRQRCNDAHADNYRNYGGRGIEVCEEWAKFVTFLADMGERPKGKTLDRIDPDGNYEPGNCRWATAKEQIMNRRPY